MEAYIFALIAFLILLPIINYLPIGLTKQGKLMLVSISFLLAIIGLLASTLFSLWQTILIILLIVIVVTYLLYYRYGKVIFEKNNVQNDQNIKKQIVFDIGAVEYKKEKNLPDIMNRDIDLKALIKTDSSQLAVQENGEYIVEKLDEKNPIEDELSATLEEISELEPYHILSEVDLADIEDSVSNNESVISMTANFNEDDEIRALFINNREQ